MIKMWWKWLISTNLLFNVWGIITKYTSAHMALYQVFPHLYQSSKFDPIWDAWALEGLRPLAIIDLEGGVDALPLYVSDDMYLYWPIADKPELPDLKLLEETAEWGYRKWQEGKNVLVHCKAGCNRSGLVNGVILHRLGMTGEQALKAVRKNVPFGLVNMVFAKYVEEQE